MMVLPTQLRQLAQVPEAQVAVAQAQVAVAQAQVAVP